MRLFKKSYSWAITFTIILTFFTLSVFLDSFVIERTYVAVTKNETETSDNQNVTATDTSYSDNEVNIKISEYREYDTDIHVADITLTGSNSIKTAFAENAYGKNVTETTSDIANENNAVLAINGDFYGARSGYVIRNGVLYRDKMADDGQEDLVIYNDGSFGIIEESEITAEQLLKNGAEQVLSFGPGLIKDGNISVSQDTEVDKAKKSNPRTAIGITNDNHIIMVTADGRTTESNGLSLYELAEFMQSLNVKCAYNLDGGGSSTMYFNGKVINNPTSDGRHFTERKVSDIVYVN